MKAIPDEADFLAAISEVPQGWWWRIGECGLSCHASIGPDVAYCDKETLIAFDAGFDADLNRPSTLAAALRDTIAQAATARAAFDEARRRSLTQSASE